MKTDNKGRVKILYGNFEDCKVGKENNENFLKCKVVDVPEELVLPTKEED